MKSFFTALGNLFRKPATVQYPFEPTYKPDDYRGLIVHNPDLCIWCRRCEIACPPGAIVFSQALVPNPQFDANSSRENKLIIAMDGRQEYHYNRAVCIYCGECVRSCPKDGALIQTATPGHPALKAENINNGWKITVDEALKGRATYMAEKKRLAAEKAKQEGDSKSE
jgi:ech hydrogenase subunit F